MRNAGEVIFSTGAKLVSGDGNAAFGRIVTDSKEVKRGDLFAAIKGKNADGNDYIEEAVSRGACAILTDGDVKSKVCTLRVDDTQTALYDLAAYYRKKELSSVVAVTGSVGKTTVKEMIAGILSEGGKVRKTRENRNNILGASLSVLEGYEEKTGVFELGISEKGEMEKLAALTLPDVAVITSIGKAHLEFFGSEEETARQKLKILEKLSTDGFLLCDGDSVLPAAFCKTDPRVLTVSLRNPESDIFADNILLRDGYSVFDFLFAGRTVLSGLKVPVTGLFGVRDALYAAAVSFLIGATYDEIRSGIAKYKPIGERQNVFLHGDCVIYSDCYNASPESFSASCEAVKIIMEKRKIKNLYIIAGSMLELGNCSGDEHFSLGEKLKSLDPERLITVGKEAEKIAEGAVFAGMDKEKVFSFAEESEKEGIKRLISEKCRESGLFFIKGSRRLKLEEIRSFLENR